MRKLALLALVPLLSACHSSHSDIEPQSEVEYIKTISVSLPEGFDTRAFSDGQTATYLTYAVYRVSDGELTLTESSLREKSLTNKRATVEVSMISGQAYKVIFWADAGEACPYTIDLSAGTVTMDYSDDNTRIEANNEARDAFYALLNVESADLSTTDTVRLRRPLAQLNVGSQSVGETVQGVSVSDIEFSVTVPAGLPTVFCLMDSTATNPTTQPIVFSATGLPSGETYPVSGYDYLLMNYMLCGADGATSTAFTSEPVVFSAQHTDLTDAIDTSFSNVPLRRNYRTNIYGQLLSQTKSFTVVLEPSTSGDDTAEADEEESSGVSTEAQLTAALLSGGAIELSADVTSASALTVSEGTSVSLDLGGHTLRVEGLGCASGSTYAYNSILTYGELTMTNGTLEMAGRLDVLGDATLLIDGVDLTFEATTYSNLGIFTPDGSTSNVCMTNSTLTLSATNQKAYGIAMQGSGHFYAKGCTIAASSESATAHGVYVSSGTVEIESSEVIGTSGAKSYGLYNLGGTCLLTASDVTSTTTGTSTNSLGVCINNNGLFAPVFLRDGCTVTAYAPNSSKNYDYGVYDGAYGWIAFTKDCEATTSIFDYNMQTYTSVTISIERDSDGNLTGLTASDESTSDVASDLLYTNCSLLGSY